MHRLDWWNIRDEHTPFEWACQIARAAVEPFGADRDDLRAAINTTRQILAQCPETLPADVVANLIQQLQFYLKSNQPPETIVTPAQAEALTP